MLYRLIRYLWHTPFRLIRRFCDLQVAQRNDALERELREARQELREAKSTNRVLELEQERFLDVIERDRQRVQAERMRYVAAGERAVKAADDHASQ